MGVPLEAGAFVAHVSGLLEEVQGALLAQAREFRDANIVDVKSYDELKEAVAAGGAGFLLGCCCWGGGVGVGSGGVDRRCMGGWWSKGVLAGGGRALPTCRGSPGVGQGGVGLKCEAGGSACGVVT